MSADTAGKYKAYGICEFGTHEIFGFVVSRRVLIVVCDC